MKDKNGAMWGEEGMGIPRERSRINLPWGKGPNDSGYESITVIL